MSFDSHIFIEKPQGLCGFPDGGGGIRALVRCPPLIPGPRNYVPLHGIGSLQMSPFKNVKMERLSWIIQVG